MINNKTKSNVKGEQTMEKKMEMLKKVIAQVNMQDEIEVNEELVRSIFGENLEIEMTESELVEMFLLEL